MNLIEVMDYVDADVAYLLGLITARGRISQSGGERQIVIEFPYQSLEVEGIATTFEAEVAIRQGLLRPIEKRVSELTGANVEMIDKGKSVDLVLRFFGNTMMWRNILMHTQNRLGFEHFLVPDDILFSKYPNGLEAGVHPGICRCRRKYSLREPLY